MVWRVAKCGDARWARLLVVFGGGGEREVGSGEVLEIRARRGLRAGGVGDLAQGAVDGAGADADLAEGFLDFADVAFHLVHELAELGELGLWRLRESSRPRRLFPGGRACGSPSGSW